MRSPQFRRSDAVIFEVTGGRAVLLTADGDELITLNTVGTLVWMALEHPSSRVDVVERLRGSFEDVPQARLEHDVDQFLDELFESELIVADAEG